LAQYPDRSAATIEVCTIEPAALGHSDSGHIEKLEHRVIAHRTRRRLDETVQELFRLVLRHERWESPCLSRASDLTGRVLLDHAVACEIAKTAPHAGEPPPDRAPREPPLVQASEIRPDQGGVGLLPRCALTQKKLAEVAKIGSVGPERMWRSAPLRRQVLQERCDSSIGRAGASPHGLHATTVGAISCL